MMGSPGPLAPLVGWSRMGIGRHRRAGTAQYDLRLSRVVKLRRGSSAARGERTATSKIFTSSLLTNIY